MNRYLTRREAAEYVQAQGLPCRASTLGKLACVGGGPKFLRFGRRVIYSPADLDDWIEHRLSPPAASTSEHENQGAAA